MYHAQAERIGIRFHRERMKSLLSCVSVPRKTAKTKRSRDVMIKRVESIGFLDLYNLFRYFDEVNIFIQHGKLFKSKFFNMSVLFLTNETFSLNQLLYRW